MQIENNGIANLNGGAANVPIKTVIVLGAARGGTSMTAGVLAHLGIFMGEPENLDPFYEHSRFSRVLKSGDKSSARALAREYDQLYPIWGIKTLSSRLWRWLDIFRDPVYVIVFRDPLATANRRSTALGHSLVGELFRAALHNLVLIGFTRLSKRPMLLVSYEKALQSPDAFVSAVEAFLGIGEESRRKKAIEFIKPSPKEYTRRARTRSQMTADESWFGYIDLVQKDRISGWVTSTLDPRCCTVELLVNGNVVATCIANLTRSDVANMDSRLPPNCGFDFRLDDIVLKDKDVVDVRITGHDELKLSNLPQVYSSTND